MVGRDKRGVQGRGDKAEGVGGTRPAILLILLFLGLACRNWDNPLDPVGNQPPAVPRFPSPADSSIQTDLDLVLSWQSYDPDAGDALYFDIFMGAASPPGLVQAGWTDTTFQPTSLACSTEYYWRVIAYDNHGDSTAGPLWRFTTAALVFVTSPDTGEQLVINSQHTIAWVGGPPGAADSALVYWSVDDGASWTRLGRATKPGELAWQVSAPATESARVKVQVYASTDAMSGVSGRFAIDETRLLPAASPVPETPVPGARPTESR